MECEDTLNHKSVLPKKSRTPNKTFTILLEYDTDFFYLCSYLPCHDIFNLQKVKLVAIVKGLYYCDHLGEIVREEKKEGVRNRGQESLYLQIYIMKN